MQLFLHIGTEKTGSSFLQSVMVNNRSFLLERGIYVPKAGKWEREMKHGRISPGNGEDLFLALTDKEDFPLRNLLTSYKVAADRYDCQAILLSNELLVNVFSQISAVKYLHSICRELGLQLQPMLLILRNPVDQALSLYKHRAKGGRLENVATWMDTGYILPDTLQNCFSNLREEKMAIQVRKYCKNSEALVAIMFRDWLGVQGGLGWPSRSVNPSLTLSELALLRQVYLTQPTLKHFVYQHMLAIPFAQKSDDKYLKKKYREYLHNRLSQYNEVWSFCNQLLSAGEQLETPEALKPVSLNNEHFSFTAQQLEAWARFIQVSRSPAFRLKLFLNRFRPILARLKWGVIDMLKKLRERYA